MSDNLDDYEEYKPTHKDKAEWAVRVIYYGHFTNLNREIIIRRSWREYLKRRNLNER